MGMNLVNLGLQRLNRFRVHHLQEGGLDKGGTWLVWLLQCDLWGVGCRPVLRLTRMLALRNRQGLRRQNMSAREQRSIRRRLFVCQFSHWLDLLNICRL